MDNAAVSNVPAWVWWTIVMVGALVALVTLLATRKGRPLTGEHVFRASRWSRGNRLLPAQVRITEDRSIATPLAADGVIMNVANAADVSAWYAKWFGAKISRSGKDTIGEIPGARIVFRETKDPIAPLRGHSLGLLGFEVTDIEGFVKRYQESGGTFDGNGTIARAQAANLAVIQLTDPWGTSIEVSQGLAAVK